MDNNNANKNTENGQARRRAARRSIARSVNTSREPSASLDIFANEQPTVSDIPAVSAPEAESTRVFSIAADEASELDSITVDDIENILTKHYNERESSQAPRAPRVSNAVPASSSSAASGNKPAANGYVRPSGVKKAPASAANPAPAQRSEAAQKPAPKQMQAKAPERQPTFNDVYGKSGSSYSPDNGYRGAAQNKNNGYVRPSAAPAPAQPKPQEKRTAQRTVQGASKGTAPAKTAPAPKSPEPRVYSGLDVIPTDTQVMGVSEQPHAKNKQPSINKKKTQKSRPQRVERQSRIEKALAKKREMEGSKGEKSALSSVVKAMIYIAAVFIVSIALSIAIINIGNDVFAFVKPTAQYDLTLDTADIDSVAELLKENGIIKYPTVFKFYANLRKKNSGFEAGTYTVSPSMNYDSLIAAFKGKRVERTEISVTIPEGYTVEDIITLFVDGYGVGTREGFISAINEFDYGYWFTDEIPDNAERKYRLEGYLFPDTYYFFSDSSEETVIDKMLKNFENKFDTSFRDRCTDLNMSVDEIITIASMIESEGKYASEYSTISSVFHNRLNNPSAETNGKLESDATVKYALGEAGRDGVSPDELKIDDPYNTYLYKGLPPGAISNPSLNAITYALYPSDTDYYYFVSRSNGYSLFAKTLNEHNANIAAIVAENAQAGEE